jgi:hypothetical protein
VYSFSDAADQFPRTLVCLNASAKHVSIVKCIQGEARRADRIRQDLDSVDARPASGGLIS